MKLISPLLSLLPAALLVACGTDSSDSSPLSEVDYFPFSESESAYIGLFDSKGATVLKGDFAPGSAIAPGSSHYLWVKENSLWHLYDIEKPNNPPVSIPAANEVTPFIHGLSLMQAGDDPICIINDRLEVICRFSEDVIRVERLSNDLFAASVASGDTITYTLYDPSGRPVYGPTPSPIYGGRDHIIMAYAVADDEDASVDEFLQIIDLNSPSKPLGVIDMSQFTPCAYDFSSGLLPASNDRGELTYLDTSGTPIFTIPGSVLGDVSDEVDYSFYGGYAVFQDKNSMFGIIDKKGDIKVRPKFTNLINLGNGRFAASKGDMMALIDSDDNTLSQDSFSGSLPYSLGGNYLFVKEGEISLLAGDGKTINSFPFSNVEIVTDNQVTYTPISPAINYLIDMISPQHPSMNPEEYAVIISAETPTEDAGSSNMITTPLRSGYLTCLVEAVFTDPIVEPVTRQVTESDGWFENTRTVTDGYKWSGAFLSQWKATVNLSGTNVDPKVFAERFGLALEKAGYVKADRSGSQYTLPFLEYPHEEMVAVITPGHHTVEITLSPHYIH